MAEGLEEKYLLSEMLPEPEHAEEQVYFQLLKWRPNLCWNRLEQ